MVLALFEDSYDGEPAETISLRVADLEGKDVFVSNDIELLIEDTRDADISIVSDGPRLLRFEKEYERAELWLSLSEEVPELVPVFVNLSCDGDCERADDGERVDDDAFREKLVDLDAFHELDTVYSLDQDKDFSVERDDVAESVEEMLVDLSCETERELLVESESDRECGIEKLTENVALLRE